MSPLLRVLLLELLELGDFYQCIVAMLTVFNTWSGGRIFCHDVSFVFNFGSNWTDFNVSTPCSVSVRDWVGSDIPVACVLRPPEAAKFSPWLRGYPPDDHFVLCAVRHQARIMMAVLPTAGWFRGFPT